MTVRKNIYRFLGLIFLGITGHLIFTKISSAPQIKETMTESIEELEKIPEEIIPVKIKLDSEQEQENIDPNSLYPELLIPKGGLREVYSEGQCELAAKEFQKIYGGNLVFIAPYNADTTAWIRCAYCGAWANRIYYKGKILWVDYTSKEIFESKEGMRQRLTNNMQYRFPDVEIDSEVFVYGEDTMPYPMIWHY